MIDQNLSRWINVLKGVAIFEIVAFHFFGDQAKHIASLGTMVLSQGLNVVNSSQDVVFSLTRAGGQGIHIFFFMSGLGLALSETSRTSGPAEFLGKRLSRVYPPFFVAVLCVAMLQTLLLSVPFTHDYLVSVLSSIFMVRNFSADWIRTINGDWWFVGAIVSMYLAYVLVRQRLRERPLAALGISFAVSFGYKILLASLLSLGALSFDAGTLNPYTAFFLNYWWEFVAGAAFVHLGVWDRIRNLPRSSCLVLIAVGLALELSGIWLGKEATGRIFNDDFFAVGQLSALTGIFLLLNNYGRWPRGGIAVVAKLGITSYGLYLVHHPISIALIHWGLGTHWLIAAIPLFVVYFLVAWAAGYLVELIAARGMNAMTRSASAAKNLPHSNR